MAESHRRQDQAPVLGGRAAFPPLWPASANLGSHELQYDSSLFSLGHAFPTSSIPYSVKSPGFSPRLPAFLLSAVSPSELLFPLMGSTLISANGSQTYFRRAAGFHLCVWASSEINSSSSHPTSPDLPLSANGTWCLPGIWTLNFWLEVLLPLYRLWLVDATQFFLWHSSGICTFLSLPGSLEHHLLVPHLKWLFGLLPYLSVFSFSSQFCTLPPDQFSYPRPWITSSSSLVFKASTWAHCLAHPFQPDLPCASHLLLVLDCPLKPLALFDLWTLLTPFSLHPSLFTSMSFKIQLWCLPFVCPLLGYISSEYTSFYWTAIALFWRRFCVIFKPLGPGIKWPDFKS